MASRRLLISGRVQGVFYRAWTERNARALGLGGWVRNLANGDVEVLATGADAAIAELIRRCWQGPQRAQVRDIKIEEADAEPVEGFRQRRD
ncbi:MAG TPA: acylphosphatase [Allosphingosinicella sp.]|nr:acylphosphatase [Allosphingosinicella sp.]